MSGFRNPCSRCGQVLGKLSDQQRSLLEERFKAAERQAAAQGLDIGYRRLERAAGSGAGGYGAEPAYAADNGYRQDSGYGAGGGFRQDGGCDPGDTAMCTTAITMRTTVTAQAPI